VCLYACAYEFVFVCMCAHGFCVRVYVCMCVRASVSVSVCAGVWKTLCVCARDI